MAARLEVEIAVCVVVHRLSIAWGVNAELFQGRQFLSAVAHGLPKANFDSSDFFPVMTGIGKTLIYRA